MAPLQHADLDEFLCEVRRIMYACGLSVGMSLCAYHCCVLATLGAGEYLLEALHVSRDGNGPPSPECHALAQIVRDPHEENHTRRALNINKRPLFAVL